MGNSVKNNITVSQCKINRILVKTGFEHFIFFFVIQTLMTSYIKIPKTKNY